MLYKTLLWIYDNIFFLIFPLTTTYEELCIKFDRANNVLSTVIEKKFKNRNFFSYINSSKRVGNNILKIL